MGWFLKNSVPSVKKGALGCSSACVLAVSVLGSLGIAGDICHISRRPLKMLDALLPGLDCFSLKISSMGFFC